MQNIFSNPKFRVLSKSKLFTVKKPNICRENGDLMVQIDPFSYIGMLFPITFHKQNVAEMWKGGGA